MNDDLLKSFINEAREHLSDIESDLLAIESRGADIDENLVNKVFRAAHSIKGGSSFFGLKNVKELAHKAETVLDLLRTRKMTPNAEVTNMLLAAFDKLRELVNNTAASNEQDISDLLTGLSGLVSGNLAPDQKAVLLQTVTLDAAGLNPPVKLSKMELERVKKMHRFLYVADYDLIHDIDKQGKSVIDVFKDLLASGELFDCSMDFDAAGTLDGPIGNTLPLRIIFATVLAPDIIDGLITIDKSKLHLLYKPPSVADGPVEMLDSPDTMPPSEKPAPKPLEIAPSAPSSAAPQQSHADDTLRVNVTLLDTLMNLAGELVLSRNQLRAAIAQKNGDVLTSANQRISQVTSELQDIIMQTRLQPIGNLFNKFPRVVRDMSAALNKDIKLVVEGKDVALDRSLLEGLSDPLTHMVRNSVDHGVETPDLRTKAGKKPAGLVRIEARHEAGQVVVEIEDDGKGIDPTRIAQAALKKGLITEEKLRGMSNEEKIALVFLPGLSTAEKVTDISGRGVGMDVVKTNLDRLGGKVEIHSKAGKGTLFRIKLPLTLAIIPSLIVSVEGERFAIPQINVEELLHVPAEEVKRRIEVVGAAEVLLLRDRIIPLVRFDQVLDITPTYLDPVTGRREVDRRTHLADRRSPHHAVDEASGAEPKAGPHEKRRSDGRRQSFSGALEIAVVTTGTQQFGLVVSEFHDTEEIVVKPLGRHLKGLHEYAGSTILGNGTVALILDVAGLAAKAEFASVSGSSRAEEKAAEAERERLDDSHSLLLFHNAPDELCAIPLNAVLRVERAAPAQIEMAGNRRTMQYRGVSLPLVTLADTAQVKSIGSTKELAVIVSNVHGREVGLLGALPIDVVEAKIKIDQTTHRQKGVSGSTILREQTTLITDLYEIVDTVYPEWAAVQNEAKSQKSDAGRVSLLLAEDSDFFRQQVKRFLEDDGYAVFDAPDGEAAWEMLLQHTGEISGVVTDIEMPRLTGLELASRIRKDDRASRLPIIALTSLAGEEDIAKGKIAGINDYQVKLDRDKLLEGVHKIIRKP